MVNDALKGFNKSFNTVNDIWKATNLTFTGVILTFMLYLKLSTWVSSGFKAFNLTFIRVILTFMLYLKLLTQVNGSLKAFRAPFTTFDKILTDNFTKQII